MTPISETQRARFYIYKKPKKLRNVYMYTSLFDEERVNFVRPKK